MTCDENIGVTLSLKDFTALTNALRELHSAITDLKQTDDQPVQRALESAGHHINDLQQKIQNIKNNPHKMFIGR